MKRVIFLSLTLSLLLFFMNNEEVLASRVKRSLFSKSIKQLAFSPDDTRSDPTYFCSKFIGYCTRTLQSPNNVDLAADALAMHKAIKGIGTKEKPIIEILTKRGIVQRLKIAQIYSEKKYGNLLNDLRDDTSGKFQDTLTAFMTPLPIYYAKELHKTLNEKGTDVKTLVEILCTIPNHAINGIKEFYKRSFNDKKLEDGIKADTSGNFQKVMLIILEANREDFGDKFGATQDAQNLHKAVKTWGKEPTELNTILATRPPLQLVQMFIEYKKISGHEFEDDIKTAFPGEDGMIAIVKALKNKPKFLAERVYETMNGPGTKDRELIRIVTSRCEIDLGDTKHAYKTLYGKTLESVVSTEIDGNYKSILLSLINGNVPGGGGPPPAPSPLPDKL